MIEGDTEGECRDSARVSPGSQKDVYYRVALSRPDVGEAPYAIGACTSHSQQLNTHEHDAGDVVHAARRRRGPLPRQGGERLGGRGDVVRL